MDSDDSDDSFLQRLVESKGVVHSPPIQVKVKLDNCVVNMEVDTGAAVSDVSDHFSREGLTTLSGAPQSLHKLLQCQR